MTNVKVALAQLSQVLGELGDWRLTPAGWRTVEAALATFDRACATGDPGGVRAALDLLADVDPGSRQPSAGFDDEIDHWVDPPPQRIVDLVPDLSRKAESARANGLSPRAPAPGPGTGGTRA
jgi:hypothetical protein